MPIDTQLNEELKSLLASGRHEEAIARCEAVLQAQGDDPDLLTVLANCELQLGRRDRAMAHLNEAAALDPQHAGSRFHLGRLLIGEDRLDDAREHLTHCLVLDPNHAGARTILARIKATQGRLDDAMTGARTALRADPEHVPALVLTAELALEQGDLDGANEQASSAVRLAPANPAAQLVMARVMEARGHLDFARQSLENAVKAAPKSIAAPVALAEFLDRQGLATEAIEPLQMALSLQPDRQDLRLALARSLRRSGQLEASLSEYQWLLDDGSPPPALAVEAAECLAQAGRGLEARSQLDQNGLIDREDARFLKARLDLADGQLESAREALESLVDGVSKSIAESARMLLSQLSAESAGADAALQDFEKEAEQGVMSPERLWQAAGLANQAGQSEQEMRWLGALLDHTDTPDSLWSRARSRLADLCDQGGDYDRAAQLLRGAGWRKPFGLAQDAGEIIEAAMASPDQGRSTTTVNDRRPAPILILGWPGCGRETLLAALGQSAECRLLAQDGWPQRREALLQILDGLDDGAPDETAQRLVRRRYLRRFESEAGEGVRPVETGVLFAPELIAMKRAFPDMQVIRVRADVDDLGLYWQLAGFADVESMKAAYDEDQQQLDGLLTAWGDETLEVDMASLIPLSSQTLDRLGAELEVSPTQEMEGVAQAVIQPTGLRPAGHARHYRSA